MTCAEARHLILHADLSALRGESDASLRAHLAGCAQCAADSAAIVGDTALLRSALVARQRQPEIRRSRRNRIAMSMIPVALAAEIALLVVLSDRPTLPVSETRRIDDSLQTMRPVIATIDSGEIERVTPAPAPARPKRRKPVASPPAVAAVPAQASESTRVVAAAPVAVDESMSIVSVRSDKQRAAIFATSNPKITVVWLTKGDSL
jgi:hypothetical protein